MYENESKKASCVTSLPRFLLTLKMVSFLSSENVFNEVMMIVFSRVVLGRKYATLKLRYVLCSVE